MKGGRKAAIHSGLAALNYVNLRYHGVNYGYAGAASVSEI